MRARGRVWKFADNVNTDVITAGKHLYLTLNEQAKHALEVLDPSFAGGVRPGDCIVAGRNFGCGSSRESAPQVLKILGVGCVVAESFARIFQRNAIAIGLPVLVVPGICAHAQPGDELEVELATGSVINHTSGARCQGRPIPERLLTVLADGGIVAALKRLGAAQG